MNAIRRTAIGVTAVALLAAPSAALGAKKKGGDKLRTDTASATAAGAFDPVAATATCPKGTRVVSGGYTTSAPSMPLKIVAGHAFGSRCQTKGSGNGMWVKWRIGTSGRAWRSSPGTRYRW